jgi:hypothetical protein
MRTRRIGFVTERTIASAIELVPAPDWGVQSDARVVGSTSKPPARRICFGSARTTQMAYTTTSPANRNAASVTSSTSALTPTRLSTAWRDAHSATGRRRRRRIGRACRGKRRGGGVESAGSLQAGVVPLVGADGGGGVEGDERDGAGVSGLGGGGRDECQRRTSNSNVSGGSC